MEVLTGSVVSPGKAFQPLSVFIEYHGARVGWRGQEDGRGELRKKDPSKGNVQSWLSIWQLGKKRHLLNRV